MRVLMMPDYRRDNPYQQLLSNALAEQGVTVLFPAGYRRVLPLSRAARSNRPIDVLHLHWLSPYLKGQTRWTYLLYVIKLCLDIVVARLCGVKIVWTIHNQLSHDARFPVEEKLARKAIAKLAQATIVHSQAAAQSLSMTSQVDARHMSVIPHGHYRDVYGPAIAKEAAREQLGISKDGLLFLYFGMVRPYKGIEELIDAWASEESVRDHLLLIAGTPLDVTYGNIIRALVSNSSNIQLDLKRISDECIPLLFSAADVVVLPFKRILTSGSILLALSYDKPVIAPNIEVLLDTVGDANALFYRADGGEEGLRRSLHLVTSNAVNLRDVSALSRKRCNDFNWDRIAELTRACYADAMGRTAA